MTTQTTAEQQALALAEQHGLTLRALAGRLLNDLCYGVPPAASEQLLDLYQATQRLLRQAPTVPSGGST
jgi:hypothetical protein